MKETLTDVVPTGVTLTFLGTLKAVGVAADAAGMGEKKAAQRDEAVMRTAKFLRVITFRTTFFGAASRALRRTRRIHKNE